MALFAVAFPTQAYADDNYPDFSYLTTIYKSDGTVALTAEQAQSLARYFCEQLASYSDKIYIYDYTDNQGSNFQEIYGVFNDVVENTEYGVFYRSLKT